jgi:hypothetical protein
MTYKEAEKVLKDYNDWRRGEHQPCDCKHSALKIDFAIDTARHALLKMDKIRKITLFGEGPITDELL